MMTANQGPYRRLSALAPKSPLTPGSAGNHSVDWMGALTKIEQRFPGYVLALHSAMRRQNEMQDKMRVQFSNAMNYARGAEPMAHLGRDILRPISVRDEKGPKLTRSSGGAVRGSLPSGYVVNKY